MTLIGTEKIDPLDTEGTKPLVSPPCHAAGPVRLCLQRQRYWAFIYAVVYAVVASDTQILAFRLRRLTTPAPCEADGGTLALWSADPAFRDPGFLQINGLAFDGARTLYTTNYSSGHLLRVAIQRDGSAGPAEVIQTSRALTTLDGIRITAPFARSLFVTESTGALSRIDISGDTAQVTTLGTFDQPTSLVRVGRDLWVAEGQDLRLQGVDPTPIHLPFVVRRFAL